MKNLKIILALIFLNNLTSAYATFQIPDILIFRGDTLMLFGNPLEQLYKIDSIPRQYFEDKKGCMTTACWRGYQAEWTIIDNQLYLTAIYSCCFREDSVKANLQRLFGALYVNGKVKANWVTDTIISPKGKLVHYVHLGYASVYEKETEFQFKNGQLTGIKTYDNSRSRSSIYCGDSRKLFEYIYSNIRWHALPDVNTDSSRVFVSFSANEESLIDSVQVLRGRNSIFNQEVIRVIKSIPGWCVLYQKGQFKRMHYNYPIAFNRELFERYKK